VRLSESGSGLNGPRVTVDAPAKLNLFLAIRGQRDDGYHELVSVLQSVSLFDRLQLSTAGGPVQRCHPAARGAPDFELVCDPADELPASDENLTMQAARVLAAHLSFPEPHERRRTPAGAGDQPGDEHGDTPFGEEHLRDERPGDERPRTVVQLAKRIPVGAGMAGGSADAAAALVALNELWGGELSRAQLQLVAAEVGSDVPFCLQGGTGLATGRGETLVQVLCRGVFSWVVCEAAEPLSTGAVYRAWDRSCRASAVEADAVVHALRGQDPEALGAALHNELEPAAFALRPQLADDKVALEHAGALGAVLSGSGPTLLALAADEAGAEAIAERVRDRFRRVTVTSSPAGGPALRSE
jgi:4-diphosphocytidyl-2-C-methyl-D-erythritol kinase